MNIEPSSVPYTEPVTSENGIVSKCKYCDFTATMATGQQVMQEISRHARARHYSWTTGLFQSDDDREQNEKKTRERQSILGEKEQSGDMNRLGL